LKRACLAAALVFATLAGAGAVTDQWPQFRGPRAGQVADDPALPDTWSETENVAWKTTIPGIGWSSPVVWDDHIFVTSAIPSGEERAPIRGLYDPGDDNGSFKAAHEHRWMLYDIDFKSGRIRWEKEIARGIPSIGKHIKNSFATETPVTDGRYVYTYMGSAGLLTAVDFKGKTIWTKEAGTVEGVSEYGSGSSPALYKDRVIIVNDNRKQSFIAAYELRTGRELWNVPRQESQSWATPLVWENELRTEIVTASTNKVRAYDLDGGLLWELKGMTNLSTPSPFANQGLVYISSGYPGTSPRPVYAIKPGASGDISLVKDQTSNEFVVWYQPLLGTYNTSALVLGNYYYTLLDRGFLLCHDAKTGKEIYGRQRISAESSGFTASPWSYNGKIFVLSEDGDTFVVQAGPEFKLLGKNSLNEMTMATPAVLRGSVLLRTQSKLYRIARAKK
jgi:putative pyrroloquinoline-quinone binding quinoprotein/putative pyrroloquinoline-quinone-binding quinoprotein